LQLAWATTGWREGLGGLTSLSPSTLVMSSFSMRHASARAMADGDSSDVRKTPSFSRLPVLVPSARSRSERIALLTMRRASKSSHRLRRQPSTLTCPAPGTNRAAKAFRAHDSGLQVIGGASSTPLW
jgi:hypothetical protein